MSGKQPDHYYPPPPPGPPPSHSTNPQHPNETPIPDYNYPSYNPSGMPPPHFAGPPSPTPGGIYDDPPPKPGKETSHAAKPSWSQRFGDWGAKAAAPINALANKIGAEAFLPTTMDHECEKAARILRGFCKDGIYSEGDPNSASAGPAASAENKEKDKKEKAKSKPQVLLTIPSKVISRAQGLLIFTTVRAGFHVTGASGSGVLVARLPDGSWSPPSGVQIHSLGAGFVIGLDIYDCVVVINSREALDAFTHTRMSLGSDLAVTAGPWGAGGQVDWGLPQDKGKEGKGKEARGDPGDERPAGNTAVPSSSATDRPADLGPHPTSAPPPTTFDQMQPHVTTGPGTASAPTMSVPSGGRGRERKPSPLRDALRKPVYSYVKSRGFYAGVQIDGTVVTERVDANAAFYGERVSVQSILAGQVHPQAGPTQWPAAARGLLDVLRGAEGWRGAGAQAPHYPQQQQMQQQPFGPPPGARGFDNSASASSGVAAGAGLAAGAGQAFPAQGSKAAEAEAEARANRPPSPGPPAYAEPPLPPADLPPAYEHDGQYRPGVGDSKTGHH